jgi:hypothetical protein
VGWKESCWSGASGVDVVVEGEGFRPVSLSQIDILSGTKQNTDLGDLRANAKPSWESHSS